MRRAALAAGLIGLGVAGCGEPAPPPVAADPIGPGVVAKIKGAAVAAETVARIAAAQRLEPSAALVLAERDALFAALAEERGVGAREARVALARAMYESLLRQAERQGPASESELEEATERHWLELARPESSQTVHAVVRFDAAADPSKRKAAAAIAAKIEQAVTPAGALARERARPLAEPGAAPPEDPAVLAFKEAANAVAHPGFEVVVEELPPVTADGRVATPSGGRFDQAFARAAAALPERGAISAPVESPFGLHVILLLERVPESHSSEEDRRAVLEPEIVTARAKHASEALLSALRRDVSVETNADALLALVKVEP